MTLRLEAYFEDQIKPILASYKSKGKRGPYKPTRGPKGKFISPSQKILSGQTCAAQAGQSSSKGSSGLSSGGRGGLQKRAPPSRLGSPASSRSGTSGRMSGPRTKRTCG